VSTVIRRWEPSCEEVAKTRRRARRDLIEYPYGSSVSFAETARFEAPAAD